MWFQLLQICACLDKNFFESLNKKVINNKEQMLQNTILNRTNRKLKTKKGPGATDVSHFNIRKPQVTCHYVHRVKNNSSALGNLFLGGYK